MGRNNYHTDTDSTGRSNRYNYYCSCLLSYFRYNSCTSHYTQHLGRNNPQHLIAPTRLCSSQTPCQFQFLSN